MLISASPPIQAADYISRLAPQSISNVVLFSDALNVRRLLRLKLRAAPARARDIGRALSVKREALSARAGGAWLRG